MRSSCQTLSSMVQGRSPGPPFGVSGMIKHSEPISRLRRRTRHIYGANARTGRYDHLGYPATADTSWHKRLGRA